MNIISNRPRTTVKQYIPRATKRSLLAPKSEIKDANKAKTPYGEKSIIISTIFKIISLSPSMKPLTY